MQMICDSVFCIVWLWLMFLFGITVTFALKIAAPLLLIIGLFGLIAKAGTGSKKYFCFLIVGIILSSISAMLYISHNAKINNSLNAQNQRISTIDFLLYKPTDWDWASASGTPGKMQIEIKLLKGNRYGKNLYEVKSNPNFPNQCPGDPGSLLVSFTQRCNFYTRTTKGADIYETVYPPNFHMGTRVFSAKISETILVYTTIDRDKNETEIEVGSLFDSLTDTTPEELRLFRQYKPNFWSWYLNLNLE